MNNKNIYQPHRYKCLLNLYVFLLLLLNILPATETYSQFNQILFKKDFNLHQSNSCIQALGDQNGDGYDDFLIYDCNEQKSYIFFGGNPIDIIPKFTISGGWISFALIDINSDGYKDLVFITNDKYPNRKIKISFGGTLHYSIPDLVFSPPPGAMNNFGLASVLKDFNGDGRNELAVYDPDSPYSKKQYGCLYFYNTGEVFDTIPHYVMYGDSAASVTIGNITSSGDINGDGKTDFTIICYKIVGGNNNYFRNFYLGNKEWNLTPVVTYNKPDYYPYPNNIFDPLEMHITDDLNKDGKSEIIIKDYGLYPYYYYSAILKGGFPIDTIPVWGLNTQNQGVNADVTELGDVNGDGFPDFISQTFAPPDAPNIKLWLGGRNIHTIADKTWYGTDCSYGNDPGFGRIYAAVGDVNGDGTNDIAIGGYLCNPPQDCEPGSIYIFNGDTSVHADTITSINGKNINPPTGYKLNDPYPNPFNPSTIISWQSSITSRVQIKLFDILGREVAVILYEERQSGNNKIEFDASKYNLTSGVYILQIELFYKGKVLYKESKKISYLK
jgi:hypothetical protein